MKTVLILGAGTAGTMAANKLRSELAPSEWQITVVDKATEHLYQPGYIFAPFGVYDRDDLVKTTAEFIGEGIELVTAEIDVVDAEACEVKLVDGTVMGYDYLIIASGTHPRPDMTEGLVNDEYGKSIHDFYSLRGCLAMRPAMEAFEGGRIVINIAEMPIKCPVAPLEITFLTDAYFTERGIRDKVEIVYSTPMSGPFTKPVASKYLGDMFTDRDIKIEADFYLGEVDSEAKKIISFDEREIEYDMLISIPINAGAEFIGRSGLGDELNHVPADSKTFQNPTFENIFTIGDAADLPTSKAGSVAHFAVEVFIANFVRFVQGLPMLEEFDGHANCFIETGFGKGMLIDFNYTTEPLSGKYPLPGVGPFSLLKETEMNHWGKLMFKWTYWNMLLPGKELPVPGHMSMAGKIAEGS